MSDRRSKEQEHKIENAGRALLGAAGEPTLGGRLFFAGVLAEQSGVYLEAAARAGAASLAVAEELAVGKAAMRSGVVNFLVNSLDEALRILKNEIRKKQPVAVCVVGSMSQIVAEMKERGVAPDLVLSNGAEVGGTVVAVK